MLAGITLRLKNAKHNDQYAKEESIKQKNENLAKQIKKVDDNLSLENITKKLIKENEFMDNKQILVYKYSQFKNMRNLKFLTTNLLIFNFESKRFEMRNDYHLSILSKFLNLYEFHIDYLLKQNKIVKRLRNESEARLKVNKDDVDLIHENGEI